MKSSSYFFRALIFCIVCAVSGCSAVVPLSSAEKDLEAKAFNSIANKSNVYVVRTCAYGGKLHNVSLDGGERISLGCQNYTVFLVEPGEHKFSVFSTENRDMLKLITKPGENYVVEMGWKMGSGTGDVQATVSLLSKEAGVEAVRKAQLISLDGY